MSVSYNEENKHNDENDINDKGDVSVGNRSGSNSESLVNTGSISSSMSSKTDSDIEIKYIEEGIDYDKTPRPILILNLAIWCLIIILLVLSSV